MTNHEVDRIARFRTTLLNRLERDIVLREDVCTCCQNACTVFHEEAQIVLRLQLFNGNDRDVIRARAANDRLHTKLQMTRHFEHIAHDRARRRTSARAFTEEHGLAYGIADT